MLSDHRIKINFSQLCHLQATLATARRRRSLMGRQSLTAVGQGEASPGARPAPGSCRPPSRGATTRSSLTSSAGAWSGSPAPGWRPTPPSDTTGSGGDHPSQLWRWLRAPQGCCRPRTPLSWTQSRGRNRQIRGPCWDLKVDISLNLFQALSRSFLTFSEAGSFLSSSLCFSQALC